MIARDATGLGSAPAKVTECQLKSLDNEAGRLSIVLHDLTAFNDRYFGSSPTAANGDSPEEPYCTEQRFSHALDRLARLADQLEVQAQRTLLIA
jgi:hypothetical protein